MFDKFPYTNFHELNLDYFINKFNEIFTEWEQLNSTMLAWKAAMDASNALWKTSVENELAAWKTATEADLNARETALRAELSAWKTATEADIGTWETDTLTALNAWKTTVEATFEAIRVQAAASATAAQTAQTAAETAQTAAETAQTAAETAAASVSASAAQIATNTENIVNLKTQLEQSIIYPPKTSFVEQTGEMISKTFENMATATRYTQRYIPLNSDIITQTNNRDIIIFNVPYYGFTFELVGNYNVYILNKYSNGEIGSEVDINAILTGIEISTNRKQYVINYSSEYYILLVFPSSYSASFIGDRTVLIPNLKTNIYQDSFSRYKDNISPTSNFTFEPTIYEGKLLTVSGESSVGGMSNTVSYNTITLKAPIDMDITCTNAIRAVIDYVNPANITSMGYNKSVVYTSAAERVETFRVDAGMWVAFSFSVNVTPDIRSSLISDFSLPNLVSAPNLTLSPYQLENALYKYTVNGNNKYINMYYHCSGNKYVHYRLQNTPNLSRLVDTWQIGIISGCIFDGENMNEELDIVENGEFESAIKEAFWDNENNTFVAASDFNGGANHSCEQTTEFALSIDGKLITDLTTLPTTLTPFKQITAVNVNNLIRVDNHDVVYAEHEKRWTFNGKIAKFDQTITFKEETYINGWECVMCKAIKNAVNRGTRRDKVGIENVGNVEPWVNVHTWGNEFAYKYYGNNATITVNGYCKPHEIEGAPNDHATTGTVHKNVGDLWINNQYKIIDGVSTPYYSKLYFDYWGEATIEKPVQVFEGDTVYSGAEYIVFYN